MRRIVLLAVATSLLVGAAIILVLRMRGEDRAPTLPAPRDAPAPTTIMRTAPGAAPATGSIAIPVDTDANRAARGQRLTAIAALESSGVGHEGWDSSAAAIFDQAETDSVKVTSVGCFVAGCAATFTYASHNAYERGLERLRASDAYRAWTGGKALTDPETLPDGSVIVALLLYRPD